MQRQAKAAVPNRSTKEQHECLRNGNAPAERCVKQRKSRYPQRKLEEEQHAKEPQNRALQLCAR